MSFALFALALAAFSQAAGASPLSTESAAIASKLPVSDVRLVPTGINVTFETHGIKSDATVISSLFACNTLNCASCSTIPLPQMFQTCLPMESSVSVAVVQQLGEALPYGVFVGPAGCTSFAQLPEINTCFNVNNGPFTDYFLNE
ncbi:hypothetical protein C8Q80DRAFT_1271346 [Daedaleopsis nitida]|nr:hypothetical protein C8Q80DRAFT_1271346 [Daedaleopsis nitida]